MKRILIVGVASVTLLIGVILGTNEIGKGVSAASGFSPYVDAMGRNGLPKDFRSRFVHLGSWAVVDDRSSKGLHEVYTERKTVDQFRETGKFPDGATLVKEIRKLESGTPVPGHPVIWGSSPLRWFVMVKDGRAAFLEFRFGPMAGAGRCQGGRSQDERRQKLRGGLQELSYRGLRNRSVFIQGYPILGSK